MAAYSNPWEHIDALKEEAKALVGQVSDRGWKLAEPEDNFFVAFRLARKDWGEASVEFGRSRPSTC